MILNVRGIWTENEIRENVSIEISHSRIKKIKDGFHAQGQDFTGHMALPGFVNAHCHLELTSIPTLRPARMTEWIEELIAKKRKLNEKKIKEGVRDGAHMLKKSGVTLVIDHISVDTPSEAFNKLPIQLIGIGEALGVDKKFADDNLKKLFKLQKQFPVPFFISPHTAHTLHASVQKKIFHKRKTPLSIHIAESPDEKKFFSDKAGPLWKLMKNFGDFETPQGNSAIEQMKKWEASFNNSLLVHGNYLSANDIKIIKKAKAMSLVHCPGSHHFFSFKDPPWEKIKSEKINISIGTDSLASNTRLNFLAELQDYLRKFPLTSDNEIIAITSQNPLIPFGLNSFLKINSSARITLVPWDGKKSLKQSLLESNNLTAIIGKNS